MRPSRLHSPFSPPFTKLVAMLHLCLVPFLMPVAFADPWTSCSHTALTPWFQHGNTWSRGFVLFHVNFSSPTGWEPHMFKPICCLIYGSEERSLCLEPLTAWPVKPLTMFIPSSLPSFSPWFHVPLGWTFLSHTLASFLVALNEVLPGQNPPLWSHTWSKLSVLLLKTMILRYSLTMPTLP